MAGPWSIPFPAEGGVAARSPPVGATVGAAQYPTKGQTMIESVSAITLATHDMGRAVLFYQALAFDMIHGGEDATFTSFRAGIGYLNLTAQPAHRQWSCWGRAVFHVADVDAFYRRTLSEGLAPHTPPRDAEWGERYFHITDPDGHELSFARPVDAAKGET